MDNRKELISYLFFGGLTFLVSIGTYGFFNQILGMNELLANVISWICAVTFAYVTNRLWVFASKARGFKGIMRELLSFFGGRVATLLIEEGILLVFITWLGLDSMLVKIVAQIIVIMLNYVISKLFVFSNK